MSVPKWGGHKAQQWTAAVLARHGHVCWLQIEGVCTRVATTGDHRIPRSVDLSLQYVVSNGRPACMPCNQHRSNLLDAAEPVDVLGLLRVDVLGLFESPPLTRRISCESPPRASGKTGRTDRTATEGVRS